MDPLYSEYNEPSTFKKNKYTLPLQALGVIGTLIIATIAILNYNSPPKEAFLDKSITHTKHSENEIKEQIKDIEANLNNNVQNSSTYHIYKVLRNQEKYYDERTGFRFYAKEIYGNNRYMSKVDGVLSSYKLPNGKSALARFRKGSTFEFIVENKKFTAKVFDIDYDLEIAIIEIKEIVSSFK